MSNDIINKSKWREHLSRRWYPGILVGADGEIKDENGFYPVLLDGAKTPYLCIAAGFELEEDHLGYYVMVTFQKELDRWVIVTLNS